WSASRPTTSWPTGRDCGMLASSSSRIRRITGRSGSRRSRIPRATSSSCSSSIAAADRPSGRYRPARDRGILSLGWDCSPKLDGEATMLLITGATGTNGRLVVEALRRASTPVRAMVQSALKATELQQAGAEVVIGDFDPLDGLAKVLTGVERVLLLSPVDERLVEREAGFIAMAKKAGVRHLVKFSAIGAHPAASFTFGRQHGQSERLVMDSGLPFTFVQPNLFMQNLVWSAGTIKSLGEFHSTLGAGGVSYVDARDIAIVITATMTEPIDRHAGRVHLVTGPATLTLEDAAHVLSAVVGKSVRYIDVPDEQLKASLLATGQSD